MRGGKSQANLKEGVIGTVLGLGYLGVVFPQYINDLATYIQDFGCPDALGLYDLSVLMLGGAIIGACGVSALSKGLKGLSELSKCKL